MLGPIQFAEHTRNSYYTFRRRLPNSFAGDLLLLFMEPDFEMRSK